MTANLLANATANLADYADNDLWRERLVIDERQPVRVIIDGRPCIHFCSNDYLNIATHSEVKKAFADSAYQHGLGSGSSAMIAGYTRSHRAVEELAAEFLGRERAILFNSGYHANLGVLTTFANRHTTIIADKYSHASLIDGALLSRARLLRYAHNDLAQATHLLTQTSSALLVTESVFSMQGDMSDLQQLAQLSSHHRAPLIVDDAHGIGVLGEQGAGCCEHYQLPAEAVTCLITPLGKAVGSLGAIVSGKSEVIELLLQSARTYFYTTALPIAICDATIAAIRVMQKEVWRRQTLQALIRFFIREANARGLILTSAAETPIKSIVVGSNRVALALQQQLLANGLLVSCIRPPTVPAGQALIRISLNCSHTEAMIIRLLDTFADLRAVYVA